MGITSKIIVIGLDGCELDYILKWLEKGDLPFFREIKKKGVFGRLKSSIPPTTFPAWPCMFTGKNPGKLGAFDFFSLEKEGGGFKLKLINTKRWHGDFIWDILGNYQKKSGIINIPFFSPTEIKGYMLDLHLGSEYPKGIFNTIGSNVDSFNKFDQKIKSGRTNELDRLRENTLIEFQVGKFLRDYYLDYDLNVQVYNILDGTAHSTQSEKILKERYMFIDNELKEHYDNEDSNIIIVSDHGMKKVKYRYYLNRWLKENNYLNYRSVKESKINSIAKIIMYRITNSFPDLEFIINDLAGVMGQKISYLRNIRNKELDEEKIQSPTSLINWKETTVYAHAANASNYIGLWLTKEDEHLKTELINMIKKIKINKQNNNIVKNIWKRENIYYGPEINKLPHLILELREDIMAHTSFAPILYRSTKTFSHDLWGTLISWGPDIKEGTTINDSHILDVTPTILHLMDIPIPSDVDGSVLHNIFK